MRFQPKQLGSEPSDRRARVRRTPSALTYLDAGEGNGGVVLNISESGMAIAVARGLTAERIPSLIFQLPQLDRKFQAAGEIVWRSESQQSVGVRFLDLTDQDRGQIRNWICAEIVSAEMKTTHEPVREGTAAKPILVMPSPRKAGAGVPFDTVPDDERAAAFERMFPSEASLKAAPAKNQFELTLLPEMAPEVTAGTTSEVIAAAHEEAAAEAKRGSEEVADAPTAPSALTPPSAPTASASPSVPMADEAVASGSELGLPDAAVAVPATAESPLSASQTASDLDWRDQWERFDAEREALARAPHVDISLYVPLAPEITQPVTAAEPPQAEAAHPGPPSVPVLGSVTSTFVTPDAGLATAATLPGIMLTATKPAATKSAANAASLTPAPVITPTPATFAPTTTVRTARPALGRDEHPRAAASANLPKFLSGSLPSRQQIPAVGAVAAKTARRQSSATNTFSVATLSVVLVLLCFALGYVIQPGAFHFSAWQGGSAELRGTAANPDGTSTTSPTTTAASTPVVTPVTSNSSSPAAGTSAGGDSNESAAPIEKQNTVTAAAKVTAPANGSSQASQPAVTQEKLGDGDSSRQPLAAAPAETRTNSDASAAKTGTAIGASPVPSSPDIVAPSPISFFPVTAPSAGSPPKLVQLPEETVVDTPAVLIRSREFLLVPAAPGEESTHPLERVHVGDRIAKAIPNYPAAGAGKIPDAGGMVHVRSTIGIDGSISAVQTISGPTNLIALAEAAVRQWRYRPSDIDGKPISVEEDVMVEFRPVR